jgi:hypothetical protein
MAPPPEIVDRIGMILQKPTVEGRRLSRIAEKLCDKFKELVRGLAGPGGVDGSHASYPRTWGSILSNLRAIEVIVLISNLESNLANIENLQIGKMSLCSQSITLL